MGSDEGPTDATLAAAMQRLDAFDFVGLASRYEDSLTLFKQVVSGYEWHSQRNMTFHTPHLATNHPPPTTRHPPRSNRYPLPSSSGTTCPNSTSTPRATSTAWARPRVGLPTSTRRSCNGSAGSTDSTCNSTTMARRFSRGGGRRSASTSNPSRGLPRWERELGRGGGRAGGGGFSAVLLVASGFVVPPSFRSSGSSVRIQHADAGNADAGLRAGAWATSGADKDFMFNFGCPGKIAGMANDGSGTPPERR